MDDSCMMHTHMHTYMHCLLFPYLFSAVHCPTSDYKQQFMTLSNCDERWTCSRLLQSNHLERRIRPTCTTHTPYRPTALTSLLRLRRLRVVYQAYLHMTKSLDTCTDKYSKTHKFAYRHESVHTLFIVCL